MEPIDERLLLEVIEEVLGNEYLEELSEMDTALAMGIIEIIGENTIDFLSGKHLNICINSSKPAAVNP